MGQKLWAEGNQRSKNDLGLVPLGGDGGGLPALKYVVQFGLDDQPRLISRQLVSVEHSVIVREIVTDIIVAYYSDCLLK